MHTKPFEPFDFTETINEVTHKCRVTKVDDTYYLERDGKIVAGLQFKETWVQVSGEPLDELEIMVTGDMIDNSNVEPVIEFIVIPQKVSE